MGAKGNSFEIFADKPAAQRLLRPAVFNLFIFALPDVISLQLCTPKVVGV
jgi:hypothetical protein